MSSDTQHLNRPSPSSGLSAVALHDLVALADDELVIGHRHSEWLGLSPFLEEDLTMTSIAQDEIGHARALYRFVWPDWETRDSDVVRRAAADWRSCALVERRSPTWEFALVRHALYDIAEPLRWRQIEHDHGALLPGFADLVRQVEAEERFHARHATDLVIRLGRANEAANTRLQRALDDLWPDTIDMLAGTDEPAAWSTAYLAAIDELGELAALAVPHAEQPALAKTGVRLVRHPDFAEITTSLLAVFAFDSAARW